MADYKNVNIPKTNNIAVNVIYIKSSIKTTLLLCLIINLNDLKKSKDYESIHNRAFQPVVG